MANNQESHLMEIADTIDTYSQQDQAFMLWYLLQDYQKFVGSEALKERIRTEKSDMPIRDYALSELLGFHDRFVKEMREILYHVVW